MKPLITLLIYFISINVSGQDKSLPYYEVPEARAEFKRMQALIETEGIKVLRAKDAYADSLGKKDIPGLPQTAHEVKNLLIHKAEVYYRNHHREKERDFQKEGISISVSASSTLTNPAAFIIAHGLYFLIASSISNSLVISKSCLLKSLKLIEIVFKSYCV